MSRRRVAGRRAHKKKAHGTCNEASSIQAPKTYTPTYGHTCTCRRPATHNVGPRRRTAIAHTRAHSRDKPRSKTRARYPDVLRASCTDRRGLGLGRKGKHMPRRRARLEVHIWDTPGPAADDSPRGPIVARSTQAFSGPSAEDFSSLGLPPRDERLGVAMARSASALRLERPGAPPAARTGHQPIGTNF